jgi:hypothetical protein
MNKINLIYKNKSFFYVLKPILLTLVILKKHNYIDTTTSLISAYESATKNKLSGFPERYLFSNEKNKSDHWGYFC